MVNKRVSAKRAYDSFASTYDATVTKPAYAYVGVERVFNVVSGFLLTNPESAVLDIGCGTGLLGQKLKSEFPDIILHGIDVSAKMRAEARKKDVYSTLRNVNLEKDRFPIKSDTIDLVVSSAVYDYVGCLKPSFDEISRVLHPEGMLCVTTCAGMDIESEFVRKMDDIFAEMQGEGVFLAHEYFHPPSNVLNTFKQTGIKAEHLETFYAYNAEHSSSVDAKGTLYHLFQGQHL